MAFAVFVTFRIKPPHVPAFVAAMSDQARNSLDKEPGCRVFEVWRAKDDPATIELYEIYDDAAAFDAHLASDHFKTFDAAVAHMVAEKRVSTCSDRIA